MFLGFAVTYHVVSRFQILQQLAISRQRSAQHGYQDFPRGSFSHCPECTTFLSHPQNWDHFSIDAGPDNVLGGEPGALDDLTAPMILKSSEHRFAVAEVTIDAEWTMDRDQGGLIVFGARQSQQPSGTSSREWLKVGLQRYDDEVLASSTHRSTNGTDFHVRHVPPSSSSLRSLRVKVERKDDGSLWAWYETHSPPSNDAGNSNVADVGKRWSTLWRVPAFFTNEHDSRNDVGMYASRPDKTTTDSLKVEFQGLDILFVSDALPGPCDGHIA